MIVQSLMKCEGMCRISMIPKGSIEVGSNTNVKLTYKTDTVLGRWKQSKLRSKLFGLSRMIGSNPYKVLRRS